MKDSNSIILISLSMDAVKISGFIVKHLVDLRANYKAQVEEGYTLARYVDDQVKVIKSV